MQETSNAMMNIVNTHTHFLQRYPAYEIKKNAGEIKNPKEKKHEWENTKKKQNNNEK